MEGMAGEGSFASPARPHPAGSAGGGTGWIPAASPAGAHSGAGAGALIGAGHQNLVEMDEALFAEIEGDREVRDDGWLRLKVLHKQATLAAALSILDKGMVTKLTSASGRSLYLVEGSMPVPYVCFRRFCSCPYFMMSVVSKADALACKHVLAARLGDALGKVQEVQVSNEELTQYLVRDDVNPKPSPSKSFRGGGFRSPNKFRNPNSA
ncbi:hypothetical protein T484DRAFT_3015893 [Baffinella frigidus]|nr:hypothetical protein T484DRAFT_3015893 [Cryptophyta sp. CCMP2293]